MQEIIAPNPLLRQGRQHKTDLFKWLAYAGMLVLSFCMFYTLALRPSSDLSIHATWAGEGDFLHPRTFLRHGAHPLWHALTALLMLTGMPTKLAAALITALLKMCELALMHRLMTAYLRDWLGRNTITLLALACALVSSLCVPWINPTVYFGIGSPNTWHSPTQMIAMVAMLLCVPFTAHCYAEFERLLPLQGASTRLPWFKALLLGALLFGSLLAKPTLMQAFLPAACLFFLVQWIRHPKNSRFFGQMILAALPAVLFMGVQYLYYFGIIVPSQGSMTLEMSWEKLGQSALSLLLIQAFPLYVLLFFRRPGRWKDPLFTLTVLLDAVGVLEYLVLGENGRRAADGNFGWAMMGGALMLWVIMLIEFGRSAAQQRKDKKPLTQIRYLGAGTLLSWHLISGVYYLVYLFTSGSAL